MDIPPQYPHQPPRTLQADVQAAGAVTDIEPDIVASAVLVAHQAELNGGRIMVDRASAIGAALQGDAGHEGWGGFVEVVVCLIWCIGIVADAPGWAVGSRQSAVGGVYSSAWSSDAAIALPSLPLRCVVGLSGGE